MYRLATQAFDVQSWYQTAVAALLGRAGVSITTYGAYHAFAGQLFKLARKMTGESLALEAAVVEAQWVARGCISSVCDGIRESVFSIGDPIAP
jgi:hypothetical protein